jgi:arsenate reductase (thioredoxin)
MPNTKVLPAISLTIEKLTHNFASIPEERKNLLKELTQFVSEKISKNENAFLNFICTHNSRRSHIAQIWAQTAATYYDIKGVACSSGGTEATAFNPRAVKAMQDAGFAISIQTPGNNPVYSVKFSDTSPVLKVFSKRYDDPFNPEKNFAAIMTCSHADENCPLVLGATKRIALTYNDPKDFDGTALEAEKYQERVSEIGSEILFAFSNVKKSMH